MTVSYISCADTTDKNHLSEFAAVGLPIIIVRPFHSRCARA